MFNTCKSADCGFCLIVCACGAVCVVCFFLSSVFVIFTIYISNAVYVISYFRDSIHSLFALTTDVESVCKASAAFFSVSLQNVRCFFVALVPTNGKLYGLNLILNSH